MGHLKTRRSQTPIQRSYLAASKNMKSCSPETNNIATNTYASRSPRSSCFRSPRRPPPMDSEHHDELTNCMSGIRYPVQISPWNISTPTASTTPSQLTIHCSMRSYSVSLRGQELRKLSSAMRHRGRSVRHQWHHGKIWPYS